jgi:hypothetical protein
MIARISKKLSEKKIRKTSSKKNSRSKITLDDFFGKLPKIEDGLKFQKKVRGEWK